MASFEVIIQRTIEQTCTVKVTAKDEDAAAEKADNLLAKEGWASKQDWELEDESLEVLEVNEE